MTSDEKQVSENKVTRGRQFPALPLPESIKIIQKAGTYSREHSLTALASYAGHSSDNSGPFRSKLASLKDWGLITSPKASKVTLTDRAMAIALPQSSETAQAAAKDAFLGFELFSKMYGDLAKGVELERANIANTAVHTLGISVQSKDKFVRSFMTSAVSVGLADQIGRDKVVLRPQNDQEGVAPIVEDTRTSDELPGVTSGTSARTLSTTPAMQQMWEFEGGAVTLSIDSSTALSLDVFRQLPSVIEAVEELVVVLGPKKDTSSGVSE